MLQADKMASSGQLTAGGAYEISNPVAFVLSNAGTLGQYLEMLFQLNHAYLSNEKTASRRSGAIGCIT